MAKDSAPRSHRRNTLNDLTGKEWIKSTKTWLELPADADPERAPVDPERSWLIVDSKRYHQNKNTELHPARYPEELVGEFLRFFTKAGEWVLDPFAGSGATLVSAVEEGRHAVGIELSEKYAAIIDERVGESQPEAARVIRGSAASASAEEFWQDAGVPGLALGENGLPTFDFIMTSPPYWDMLRHSRGGVESAHKKRAKKGLDTDYSDDPADLGNIASYDEFIQALCGILDGAGKLLRAGRYMVVVVQNLRAPDGEIVTLAWDIQRHIGEG
ncbi:MAG TPA: DNA methyltransferase, partial [Armatimonadota bacterium]|nr:DNA methyltransferase [Armatimonadota bacterium]